MSIHFHSFRTLLTISEAHATSSSLMSTGSTTMSVSRKVMNRKKAAFHTNQGLLKPLVMFFGLTNSPATFQTMINDIFQDLISEGVVCVYSDDILIFTETMEEHDWVTGLVLERLQQKVKLYNFNEFCVVVYL